MDLWSHQSGLSGPDLCTQLRQFGYISTDRMQNSGGNKKIATFANFAAAVSFRLRSIPLEIFMLECTRFVLFCPLKYF